MEAAVKEGEGARGTPKMRLLEPSAQAEGFGRIREDHRAEIADDYVELIADLIEARGEARAVDLAERLGVTNATVANTIAKLQRDGPRPLRALPLDLPHRSRPRPRPATANAAPDRPRLPRGPGL